MIVQLVSRPHTCNTHLCCAVMMKSTSNDVVLSASICVTVLQLLHPTQLSGHHLNTWLINYTQMLVYNSHNCNWNVTV